MKRILIVDDSMFARMVLKDSIPSENTEIHEAANGKEALEKFREISPHVVFLDLNMPDMGGIDVLKRLRPVKHGASIYVISADLQKVTREKVMSLGATEMMKKPPQKGDIVRIIQELREEVS